MRSHRTPLSTPLSVNGTAMLPPHTPLLPTPDGYPTGLDLSPPSAELRGSDGRNVPSPIDNIDLYVEMPYGMATPVFTSEGCGIFASQPDIRVAQYDCHPSPPAYRSSSTAPIRRPASAAPVVPFSSPTPTPQYKPQRRPHSAMAATDADVQRILDPYLTHYRNEYPRRGVPGPRNARPSSMMPPREERPLGDTIYEKEYSAKRQNPNPVMWKGGNNPHPSKAFMVWKYATNKDGEQGNPSLPMPELTNDKYDEVMRGKTKTIYQKDYVGLPQGNKLDQGPIPADWKNSVPYALDSLQRYSYQNPNQPSPLKNNTTRFGNSASDRHRRLIGGAPNAQRRESALPNKTTYVRHFNETAPQLVAAMLFPENSTRAFRGKGLSTLAQMYTDRRSRHSAGEREMGGAYDLVNTIQPPHRAASQLGVPMSIPGIPARAASGRIPGPQWNSAASVAASPIPT